MKTLKKVLAVLTLGVFVLPLVACVDRSWALKAEDDTISTGEYVFYLMDAYQSAHNKLAEQGITTTNIAEETIEEKSAPDWIVSKAIDACKEKLAIEQLFKEKNLELTEEELKKADESTNSIWESSGSMYERNFGINKDAIHQAYSLLNAKREKLFNAYYGKDGSDAVSDEEITDYYKKNYISLKFYAKMPTTETETSNENSEENAENKEEKKVETDESIQKQFGEYVEAINNGSKKIDQIRDLIKANDKVEGEHDPLAEQVINLSSPAFPQEIIDAVKDLAVGKAAQVKFNDAHFFLYKSAGGDTLTVPDLNNETERAKILYDMKSEDFEQKLEVVTARINITINYNAVNQYDPIVLGQNVIQG